MPGKQNRILHTMLRVQNLDKSLKFYTEILGMEEMRRMDVEAGRFTLVFLGYAHDPEAAQIELTYNWDHGPYELGEGFGHIALGVPDVREVCEKARHSAGKVTREPGPLSFSPTVIAFLEDPDGYKIELIEEKA